MKKFLLYFVIVLVGISGVVLPLDTKAEETEEVVINEDIPELYIKAVNPGYTVDGKSNVGEMIEISRKNSDAPISLAGTAVGYTNSSGNSSTLFEFPENSWMTGETILLRLASSPGNELAAINYKKTLAFKGGISLKVNGEAVDEVCWMGSEGCYVTFKSTKPTTLVRNLETGEFEHTLVYEPVYDEESYYVEQSKEEEGYGSKPSQCKSLRFSEILTFYEASKAEQFIELYNSGAEQILMTGCQIRYKNKNYNLSGILKPESYFIYYPKDFSLTKNPVNSNTLELIDTDGKKIDALVYPNGQRKGTAYALIGFDKDGKAIWRTTYAPTPGEPNNYQEFKTCEDGKVINKATGNCVKVTTVKTKICKEGYYLNVFTGRCKKIETKKTKTCKEGYYLNPETNRCRKIKENNGADYSLEPETYEEKSSFIALYAVLGVVGVGIIYLIYEFRRELWKLFGRVCRRFRK